MEVHGIQGPSSLDEWVAVRPDVFAENGNPGNTGKSVNGARKLGQAKKAQFHVGWNRETTLFSVTFNEGSRLKSDTTSTAFTGCLSASDLCETHACLRNLTTQLDSIFPPILFHLSSDSWYNYFISWWNPVKHGENTSFATMSEEEIDTLTLQIRDYLMCAYEKCSRLSVLSCLFPEEFSQEDYFENLSEFRHKSYLTRLAKCKERVKNVTETRTCLWKKNKNSQTLLLGVPDYEKELSEAVGEYLETVGDYYNYLNAPFRDLREISKDKIASALKELGSPDVGEKFKAEAEDRICSWTEELKNCSENLLELQLEYFGTTRSIYSDYTTHLDKELKCIGNCSAQNTSDTPVHCRSILDQAKASAQLALAAEEISYWNLKISRIRGDKTKIYSKVAGLGNLKTAEEVLTKLKRIEMELYREQKDLLQARETVLQRQDKFWRLRLKQLQLSWKLNADQGEEDEGDVFFDAVENERQLEQLLGKSTDPRIVAIKEQLLSAHKQLAGVRNQQKKLKECKAKGDVFETLVKSEGNKAELLELISKKKEAEEGQKSEKVRKERNVTLERIKQFKSKKVGVPESRSRLGGVNLGPSKLPPPGSLKRKDRQVIARPGKEASKRAPSPNPSEVSNQTFVIDPVTEPDSMILPQPSLCVPPPPPPPLPSFVPLPPPPPPPSLFASISSTPSLKPAKRNSQESLPANNSGGMDSVLNAIKAGVQLKPVNKSESTGSAPSLSANKNVKSGSENSLMRAIEERLKSVRKAMESEDEEEDEDDKDADDFSDE